MNQGLNVGTMNTRRRSSAGLALVIAATLLVARLTRADVDLTGTWLFSEPPPGELLDVVQVGTSLSIEGVAGTIDPVSGIFSVESSGPPVFPVCFYRNIEGVAAPDGNSMSGTVFFGNIANPPHLGSCIIVDFSFTGVRVPVCGNGIVEPGEQCDDVNPFAFDCCSGSCVLDAAGSSCAGDFLPCTADVCDGAGTCTHPAAPAGTICRPAAGPCDAAETCDGSTPVCPANLAVPAGTICRPTTGPCDAAETCDGSTPVCPADIAPDSDGDGIADVCDLCPSGTPADKPRLRLATYDGVPNNDALRAAGQFALSSAAVAAVLDPVAQGLEVVIGAPGTPGELDVVVPPGAFDPGSRQGWKVAGSGRTWKFRGADPALPVVRASVRLSLEEPPRVVVKARGKRRNFATLLPELPLAFRIILAPPGATSPACGETVFAGLGAQPPRCELRSNGAVLVCR